MADPRLHERNWKHRAYDKEMRIKILQAKFTQLVSQNRNGEPLTVVEEKLIQSAAALSLATYQLEQEYLKGDAASPAKEYLPALNALRAVLDKLGVYPEKDQGSKGGDLLSEIINR